MYILQESTHFTHFVAIYAYFYVTLGGSAQIITILHRGGSARFITILHRGGPSNLLQYYIGVVCPLYYNITIFGVHLSKLIFVPQNACNTTKSINSK